MLEKEPREAPAEPDPNDRDEHAYEDTWYRALKAQWERRHTTQAASDDGDPPASTS